MKTSAKGIDQLIAYEGNSNKAYQDVAGFWTIGVGHLLTRSELTSGKLAINGRVYKWRDGLTNLQSRDLLRQDLADVEDDVNALVESWLLPSLNQQHFDVLVSFVFNLGASAFRQSTLLRYLNEGRITEIPDQLRRWVYAGGVRRRGLVKRREKEAQLWLSANRDN